MLGILRKFIKAERTGKWLLHLQTVRDILTYFAATGHNAYICVEWQIWNIPILMYIITLWKGITLFEEVIDIGEAYHLTLLLNKCSWEAFSQ